MACDRVTCAQLLTHSRPSSRAAFSFFFVPRSFLLPPLNLGDLDPRAGKNPKAKKGEGDTGRGDRVRELASNGKRLTVVVAVIVGDRVGISLKDGKTREERLVSRSKRGRETLSVYVGRLGGGYDWSAMPSVVGCLAVRVRSYRADGSPLGQWGSTRGHVP